MEKGISIQNTDAEVRREWVDEERWHIEHATTDLAQFMRPLADAALVPDVAVSDCDGAECQLATYWQQRPLLLLLGSLTCPPSRLYNRAANDLAEIFGSRLNVAVLYVIDAYPSGDMCPYTGTDWLTKDNADAGIRIRQPRTQDERNQ